jgi:hypothetical protein
MKEWYWSSLNDLKAGGFEFCDIIAGAITLANEFPTANGYEYDVHDSTAYLIKFGHRDNLSK